MVFDAHDKAAVRNAPAWDRWQEVRLPETVDEADAAIVLARMKLDALESRASIDPERAADLQYAADNWSEKLVKLEWAREVLRAGASPWATKYAELQERYNRVVRLASDCPDTRTLIDTLLRRVQRANELLDQWRFDRTIAEETHAEVIAKKDRLRAELAERDATITELKAAKVAAEEAARGAQKIVRQQDTVIAQLRAAITADSPDRRETLIAHMHSNEARALFVVDEIRANGGEHTPLTRRMMHNALNGLPAGYYAQWLDDMLPKIKARMAERDAENAEGMEAAE